MTKLQEHNREDKIQEIAQAVIELLWGDLVEWTKKELKEKWVNMELVVEEANDDKWIGDDLFLWFIDDVMPWCWEAIATTLDLSRLLSALENKYHCMTCTWSFEWSQENPKSTREEYNVLLVFKKVLYMWDKVTDNKQTATLQDQSDECIEFLNDTLFGKK